MTISIRWIWAVAVVAVMGLGSQEARADRKIDWSQYIEQPGERPPPSRSVDTSTVVSHRKAKMSRASKQRRIRKHRARARAAKHRRKAARRK